MPLAVAKKTNKLNPVGQRIRDRRDVLGLTQTDLAEAVGVSRVHIARLETSPDFSPSLELLQKLAGALDCTVSELVRDVPPIA